MASAPSLVRITSTSRRLAKVCEAGNSLEMRVVHPRWAGQVHCCSVVVAATARPGRGDEVAQKALGMGRPRATIRAGRRPMKMVEPVELALPWHSQILPLGHTRHPAGRDHVTCLVRRGCPSASAAADPRRKRACGREGGAACGTARSESASRIHYIGCGCNKWVVTNREEE